MIHNLPPAPDWRDLASRAAAWYRGGGDAVIVISTSLLMLFGVLRIEMLARARSHDRAEQVARIHEAGCSTYDTLHRVIAKQPPPNRAFYRRLGFTDAQIDVIAEAVEQSKAANLDLLGPRDPTCPPPKEP